MHRTKGNITPLKNNILVTDFERGERKLASGLILLDDDGKDTGIRPRQATVYAIGSLVVDVQVGDRILIEHGAWTRGIEVETDDGKFEVFMVNPDKILGVYEEE